VFIGKALDYFMATWRAKLIQCLPDFRSDWEDPDNSIYLAFADLTAMCEQAHDRGDEATLRAIYDFAAWCSRQKDEDLWNAAGVSFYEHIVDHPGALRDLPRWVPPDVFHDISALLQARMEDKAFSELKSRFSQDKPRGVRS